MMVGSVIFFKKENTIVSNFISNLTKSEFTHVGLIVDWNEKNSVAMVVDANRFKKVDIIPVQFNPKKHAIFQLSEEERAFIDYEKMIKYAYSQVGEEYDYLQILGIFISLLLKGDRSAYFNSKNKIICSELIDIAYFISGAKRKNNSDIGDVTPKELLDIYNFKRMEVI